MKITRCVDGLLVHMHDKDSYDVTDDNGVDVFFTKRQIRYLKRALERVTLT